MEYMLIFLENGCGYGKANKIRSAVVKLLLSQGYENILSGQRFKTFLKGYKNLTQNRRKDRQPIRSSQLHLLVTTVTASNAPPVIQQKIFAAFSMGYFLLFRISEIFDLKNEDLTVSLEQGTYFVKYVLRTSKTSPHDPVSRKVRVPADFAVRLQQFWPVHKQHGWKGISRKLLNTIISSVFQFHKGFYSFHSLRHGGVRDLYEFEDRAWCLYVGRWKSMSTLRIYLGL